MKQETRDRRARTIERTIDCLRKKHKIITHQMIADETGFSKRTIETYTKEYDMDKPDARHYTPPKKRRTPKRR